MITSRCRAAVASLVLLAACSQPLFPGPQIQRPVEGFFFDANSTQGRNVFPQGDMIRQGAWWSGVDDDDEYSSIFITTYRGGADRTDVQAARDFQADRYGRNGEGYGGLEMLQIDGQTAWGWLETSQFRDEISSYEFKAVVSYDSISHVVEFYTREPRWMHPDTLRAVVGAFGIGRTEWNLPGLGLALVATMVLGSLMWDRFSKMRVTAGRVEQMRLAVIPVQDADDEPVAAVATDGVAAADQAPPPDIDHPHVREDD